jgi:putative tryptophan/tyrosine transport system substrate-binding protein
MQFGQLKRREFITLLGGAAAWPLVAHAQQARTYRIGVLAPFPAGGLAGIFDGLRQLGFVEGQNLFVDGRGYTTQYDLLPHLAEELVNANVDAIVCAGDASIRAAQRATTTIPILGGTDDMIGTGLARSLARPGSNTTGVSLLAADLDGKREELLFDFFPNARRVASLADTQTSKPEHLQELEDAARTRGVTLSIYRVERSEEIGPAVEQAKAAGNAALNVLASPLLHGERRAIIVRTTALHLPAIYQWPETAREGGLLAYGPRFSEFLRQWARQIAKVLRGAIPADLPIEQPTHFELVVNMKTAKAMGIDIAPVLLARADEVIE